MTPISPRLALGLANLAAFAAMGARVRHNWPTPDARSRTVALSRIDAPWLRIPQQLGTPWALGAAAAVGIVRRDRPLAACATLTLPVEKGLEVLAKKATETPRPARTDRGRVCLRDDAPTKGSSFPSGHAAIAAAAAYLIAPRLPAPAAAALWAAVPLTAIARVQQGAHHSIDSAAGVCLGLATAALLTEAADHVLN